MVELLFPHILPEPPRRTMKSVFSSVAAALLLAAGVSAQLTINTPSVPVLFHQNTFPYRSTQPERRCLPTSLD